MNRTMKSVAVMAAFIASFAAFGMMAEESDAGGHVYYDIDLGDRILEVGQTMEIDLAERMVSASEYYSSRGGSYTDMDVTSDAPSWIRIVSEIGDTLSGDSDIRLILTPDSISSGKYVVIFETERTKITSVTMMTFTVSLDVVVVPSSSQGDMIRLSFESDGGYSDYSELTCVSGSAVTLPGAEKQGYVLTGWFDGETLVGNPGDTFVPRTGTTLSAVWESDPNYTEPGSNDWMYSAAILAVVVAIAAIVIIRGRS